MPSDRPNKPRDDRRVSPPRIMSPVNYSMRTRDSPSPQRAGGCLSPLVRALRRDEDIASPLRAAPSAPPARYQSPSLQQQPQQQQQQPPPERKPVPAGRTPSPLLRDGAPRTKPWIGTLLQLKRQLGRGSFGEAWLAEAIPSGGSALPPPLAHFPSPSVVIKMTPCPQNFRYALKEVELLRKLQHPYIVRYIDSWREGGTGPYAGFMCTAMEYCDSGDLQQLIDDQRLRVKAPFTPEIVAVLVLQIASAVSACHSAHIMHRDIKPQNIFLTRRQRHNPAAPIDRDGTDPKKGRGSYRTVIALGDFGASRDLAATLEARQSVIGTPYYMCPELVAGKPYTTSADMWAVGVVAFELMTLGRPFEVPRGGDGGRPPIRVLYDRIQHDDPMPLLEAFNRRHEHLFPPWLLRLVRALLSKDPAQRPTATEILTTFAPAEVGVVLKKHHIPAPLAAAPLRAAVAVAERPRPPEEGEGRRERHHVLDAVARHRYAEVPPPQRPASPLVGAENGPAAATPVTAGARRTPSPIAPSPPREVPQRVNAESNPRAPSADRTPTPPNHRSPLTAPAPPTPPRRASSPLSRFAAIHPAAAKAAPVMHIDPTPPPPNASPAAPEPPKTALAVPTETKPADKGLNRGDNLIVKEDTPLRSPSRDHHSRSEGTMKSENSSTSRPSTKAASAVQQATPRKPDCLAADPAVSEAHIQLCDQLLCMMGPNVKTPHEKHTDPVSWSLRDGRFVDHRNQQRLAAPAWRQREPAHGSTIGSAAVSASTENSGESFFLSSDAVMQSMRPPEPQVNAESPDGSLDECLPTSPFRRPPNHAPADNQNSKPLSEAASEKHILHITTLLLKGFNADLGGKRPQEADSQRFGSIAPLVLASGMVAVLYHRQLVAMNESNQKDLRHSNGSQALVKSALVPIISALQLFANGSGALVDPVAEAVALYISEVA